MADSEAVKSSRVQRALAVVVLPYSVMFLILWTVFLLGYRAIGFPPGLKASDEYVMP